MIGLYESLLSDEDDVVSGIDIKDVIINWLENHHISKYTLNSDNSIDCKHLIIDNSIKELPEYIRFNKCTQVTISNNSNLESLRGFPKTCRDFMCWNCKKLTTLKGCPKEVVNFYCDDCENLISLKGGS